MKKYAIYPHALATEDTVLSKSLMIPNIAFPEIHAREFIFQKLVIK